MNTSLQALPPQLEEASSSFNPRQWLDMLHRRKWSVVTMLAASAVVVTCMLASAHPIYVTTARLLVDAVSLNIQSVDTSNPLSTLIAAGAEHGLNTQTQIINSEPYLKDVFRALKLTPRERAELRGVTASATGEGETDVIAVSARSSSPELAARVATGVAEHYADRAQEAKLDALKRTREYLQAQLLEAQKTYADARDRLVRFRVVTHLHPDDDAIQRMLQQQAELNASAGRSRNDLAAVNGELAALRRQLAETPATLKNSQSTPNPQVVPLQDELKKLQAELAEKQTQYQPQSEILQDLRKRISDARGQLAAVPEQLTVSSEVPNLEHERLERAIKDVERQQQAAQARVAKEQRELAPQTKASQNAVPWSNQLEELARAKNEAQLNERDSANKLRDLEVRERALPRSVRLLEAAPVPSTPVEPVPSKIIGVGLMLGLALGLALAFAQELLDNRIHSPEDAEAVTSLPTLGVVPTIPSARCPTLLPEDGHAVVTECYRAIRTAIQFSSVDNPVRTMAVASSSPGEGKSVTSINLATVMAFQGYRVILVDADLRRPSIHKLLQLESARGLSDVLAGEVSLEEALKPTNVENLQALTCGSRVPNPAELLGSEAMSQLIQKLRETADFIVFDTPPCLPVTDAEVLASQVDGTVLVVEAGRAQKEAVRTSVELLNQVRARVLGCVLNKIDQSKKGAYYHYYYYRGGYRYYGDRPNPERPRRLLSLGSGSEQSREERRASRAKRS